MMLEPLGIHVQQMSLDTDPTPFTKINSQWSIDLTIKHTSMKLLQDNIGESLDDLVFGNGFLEQHQRHDP